MVRAREARMDATLSVDPHERQEDPLHLGRQRDGGPAGELGAERHQRRPGKLRRRELTLRLYPRRERAPHPEDAAVDEHGAADRVRPVGRERERDIGAPGVPHDDRPAHARGPDHRQGIAGDVIEPVSGRGLRRKPVAARVVGDDAEPPGESGDHQVPDPLGRGQAMVEEDRGRVVRRARDLAGAEAHASVARHVEPALFHASAMVEGRPWRVPPSVRAA